MNWHDLPVLVTGGASFIGSHLVEALVALGAKIRVADNFLSGKAPDIADHAASGNIVSVFTDLRELTHAREVMDGMAICFHLAARHGGRGFVDRYQAHCATNFLLDSAVFQAAREAGTKVVYASSGCVYPMHMQRDSTAHVRLAETDVGPPYDADNVYGYAKLMGEVTLRAMHAEYGLRAAIGRFFTVFGERGYETHAVTAMIARAFLRQDPFVVWGTGEQRRNWTHVSDIVRGLILLAERVDDGTAVNLGTSESIRVIDAVQAVIARTHDRYDATYAPRIETRPDAPTGPANRVADPSLAKGLLGWEPEVRFFDGLARMQDWYFGAKDVATVRAAMDREG